MGNNSAFRNFENVIIAVYDKGALDRDLLESICEAFRDQDADWGGYEGIQAKNGKELKEIVILAAGKEYPQRPDAPDDCRLQTEEQQDAIMDWEEAVSDLFDKIANL